MTYSRTVTAAMEGAISGVPAIAVSLDSYREIDFSFAAHVAARLAEKMADNGWHAQTLLNVNVPAVPA